MSPQIITEDRVENIVTKKIEAYEQNVGAVRHRENSKKIDRLTWIVGVGTGIVLALQFVMLLRH